MNFRGSCEREKHTWCPIGTLKRRDLCTHAVQWALGVPRVWWVRFQIIGRTRNTKLVDSYPKRRRNLWDGIVLEDILPIPNGCAESNSCEDCTASLYVNCTFISK